MILAIAALLVFGLAIVAYSYQVGSDTPAKAACACCKGDSCPMKKKDGTATAEKADCDCDCCKGDSCPMKHGDHAAMASGDHKNCDCPCCHHDKEKKDTPAV